MKKVLLTTAIALCTICTMVFTCFAATPTIQTLDNWNGIVAVSGAATPGTYVNLTVLNPEFDADDFASAPLTSVQYYEGTVAKDEIDCTHAGADGANYCFHIKINGGSGDYTFITNADGEKNTQTLSFAPVEAKQRSIQDINGFAEESDDQVNIADLDTAMKNFSLKTYPLYTGTDKVSIIDALIELKPEDGYEWDDAEALNTMEKVLKEACLIAAYNTDNSEVLESDGSLLYLEDIMNLTGTDELADYNGILDNGTQDTYDDLDLLADKSLITKDIFKNKYTNIADIEDAFKESVRFRVLVDYNARGYGHIEEFFERYSDYYEEVGFDFDKFEKISDKDDIYSQVAASNAADITALKKEFNNLLDGNKNSGNKKPSGGGGISYGGGTVPNNSADKADEEVKEEEPGEPVVEPAPPAVETVGGFADVPTTHWAAESIKALAEEGILSGRGDGKFDIDGTITRAELIKIAVMSILGEADDAAANPFADASEHWAKAYIATAVKEGITTGITDTEFAPDGLITREQAATILHRAIVAKGITLETDSEAFADDASISDWAKDAVYALKVSGIIAGRDGNNFCPGESLTRAEAAKLVYMIKNLK